MSYIRYENVVMYYKNSKKPAIDNVTIDLDKGKVIVFVGPSGCGKTTLLKMLNRLFEASSGSIYLDGENVREKDVVKLRRSIGYSVQQTGLFPHMSVKENISVVPKLLKWDEEKINNRVEELLKLVDLEPSTYKNRYPNQMSGGQQQRVGIARSLAANPEIIIMDEPFSAIDPVTRLKLQDELLKMQKKESKTILFVTHDIEEALKLSDTIVILKDGKLVQYGSPFEIVFKPENDFVEKFIGSNDIVKKLDVIKAKELMEDLGDEKIFQEISINENENLKKAFSVLLEKGVEFVAVTDNNNNKIGKISINTICKINTLFKAYENK